jgi:hypothetical protein
VFSFRCWLLVLVLALLVQDYPHPVERPTTHPGRHTWLYVPVASRVRFLRNESWGSSWLEDHVPPFGVDQLPFGSP